MKGGPTLQEGMCVKCGMPLLIERVDGIPLCGECDTNVRKSAYLVLQNKKKAHSHNKVKMSLAHARYVDPNAR
jgi:ribosomal protein L37AE/L43A